MAVESRLVRTLLDGHFAITAEIAPPVAGGKDSLLAKGRALKALTDAVNVTDGASAKVAMSSLAAAAILAAEGIEPVLQCTCRDRNRIALQSDLLGAAALGIHNVLVLTGDDPKAGDQPDAKPVFDLKSQDVIRIAAEMRDKAKLPSGRDIEAPPRFFIGCADVPTDPKPGWKPDALALKADTGAQFVQTQLNWDVNVIKRWMARISDAGLADRLFVLIGIGPLASARSARWMRDNLFGGERAGRGHRPTGKGNRSQARGDSHLRRAHAAACRGERRRRGAFDGAGQPVRHTRGHRRIRPLEAAVQIRVIDGNAEAAELGARIAAHARRVTQARGRKPTMAVIMVGEDAAGEVYARNKVSQAARLGIEVPAERLPATATPRDVRDAVERLNADDAVDAILVQLPLPGHLDENEAVAAIAPEKDVDGMHPLNLGLLASGRPSVVPCTANACVLLARKYGGDLSGREALVVGRSAVVGRPLGHLLLAENCTVTTAHSATRDLAAQVGRADILVSATGRAELIEGGWIKPGALVIDVGTARIEGADGKPRYVGDVEFESAKEKAAAITPVPGGVGPMTVACLLWNTVLLAGRRAGLGDIE